MKLVLRRRPQSGEPMAGDGYPSMLEQESESRKSKQ